MNKIENKRVCRICGCSDDNACYNDDMGICWWVEKDLCSHCDAETVALHKNYIYDLANELKPSKDIKLNQLSKKAI